MFPNSAAGGDKSLGDLEGRPMLAHVLGRFSPQVSRVVINANGDATRFSQFNLPVVADSVGGFAGPLAGVLAGMEWCLANAPASSYIATVSADAPFIPTDLVERLVQASSSHPKSIAIARSNGELHPVIGLWPIEHVVGPAFRAVGRNAQSPGMDRPTWYDCCRFQCDFGCRTRGGPLLQHKPS